MATGSDDASDPRPVLAIIANSLPPYRLHFHRRIVREIQDMRLATVLTHEVSNAPWALAAANDIGLISFGHGEQSGRQDALSRAGHEWMKGGRIIRWLKNQKLGAVLVNGYNDAGRLRIMRWAHRNSIPVLLFGDSNIDGDLATGLRGILKRKFLLRILRNVDAVLPCGTLGRMYFEKYGVSSKDIFYSPYEPNYQQIQDLGVEELRKAADRFGIKPRRRRLVFSGRLVPVKRPEMLFTAFGRIAKQRPEWDLVVVGDGPMREQLKKMLSPELSDRVTWTGFLDDQETVAALYRNCDVLVLPSDYEPWALVVNEAAAAGLAIVCSNVVGAAADLVRSGRNGQLFSAGSLERLEQALLQVTDPGMVDTLKAGSIPVLNEWRCAADPVQGLQRALRHVRHAS